MWDQAFGSAASRDCWADRQLLTRISVLHDSTTRWLQSMTAANKRDVNSGLCAFCLSVLFYRQSWKWGQAPIGPACLVPELWTRVHQPSGLHFHLWLAVLLLTNDVFIALVMIYIMFPCSGNVHVGPIKSEGNTFLASILGDDCGLYNPRAYFFNQAV
jgi:hypothetical protein